MASRKSIESFFFKSATSDKNKENKKESKNETENPKKNIYEDRNLSDVSMDTLEPVPVVFKNKNFSQKEQVKRKNTSSVLSPSSKKQKPSEYKKKVQQLEEEDELLFEQDESEEDDSEDEYKPDKKGGASEESSGGEGSAVMSTPPSTPSPKHTPAKTPSRNKFIESDTEQDYSKTKSVKKKLMATKVLKTPLAKAAAKSINNDKMIYLHETLDFLKEKYIKDSEGRRFENDDYDRTTLHIPKDFLHQQTPVMQQWWTMKAQNFNVVLLFKLGKFYELFHMDADIGVRELGLLYMTGSYAHCGFPEPGYGRYASILVQKGYVVARVEQVEKPADQKERVKNMKKVEKVDRTLKREICQITTIGTQRLTPHEGAIIDDSNAFLMSILERSNEGDKEMPYRFGVCLVDTMTGEFHLSEFIDDRMCSRLCTVLAHYDPRQVLYERGTHQQSAQLRKILQTGLASVLKVALKAKTEFWTATKTIKVIGSEKYFDKSNADLSSLWPGELAAMLSEEDVLGTTPRGDCELAWSCLGACIYYLKTCLIDHQVLANGSFSWCDMTSFKAANKSSLSAKTRIPKTMVLDSVTLANLEILLNSEGTSAGSLISRLDNCKTLFGKRLLRQWVCAPLCRPKDINCRLDAVEQLQAKGQLVSALGKRLSKLVDLEKLMMKVQSLSKGCLPPNHPDHRAVQFDEEIYRKRSICDLITLLESFHTITTMLVQIEDRVEELTSSKLRALLAIENSKIEGGCFPDVRPALKRWRESIDFGEARATGKIAPPKGSNPAFDEACANLKSIESRLQDYLNAQKKELCCPSLTYRGTANNRFQIEMPSSFPQKNVPMSYTYKGQRKGFRSYRTAQTDEFLQEMIVCEVQRDKARSETLSILFKDFKNDCDKWQAAVRSLAELDCLLALADFARASAGEGPMCRPEVLPPSDQPVLEMREARHPCLLKSSLFSGGDFIPNDTMLLGDKQCMLLTGPNMGGKSTLMRQVGLNTILAQIGSLVPAELCRLTSCDRVFTRLGAADRIMSGESTFYVELSETCTILKSATRNSLILLDELGRGTATYDGTAIASAVLDHISSPLSGSRSIFSTHYHTLIDDFKHDKRVLLAHMACMADDDDGTKQEKITFLYKLSEGACSKSYGFFAASLAGLPASIIDEASEKAKDMTVKSKKLEGFREVMSIPHDQDPLDFKAFRRLVLKE